MTSKTHHDLLYLDDIQVGHKFGSDSHTLDTAQIKAFATQFDPQPFHPDDADASNSLLAALSVPAARSTGPCRHAPAIFCMSRVR